MISGLEGENFTDEIRSEFQTLQTEHGELHTRQQAAILSEGVEASRYRGGRWGRATETPAEIRSLLQRSSARAYLARAVAGIQIDGAEAELNAALQIATVGAGGGVLVPWEMLSVPEEVRADAPSTTTQLAGPIMQRSILQRLFGRSVLAALGVRIDSVPGGRAQLAAIDGGCRSRSKSRKSRRARCRRAEFHNPDYDAKTD